MRWLILLILVLLAVFHFLPEQEPPHVDESIIGEQVKPLRKAEGFEDQYLDATEARKERLEEELEKGDG